MQCCACGVDTNKTSKCGGLVCGECVSKLKESAPSASTNSSSREMPTREEFFAAAQEAVTYEMNYRERLIVIGLYEFISRHFGH